MTKNEYLEIAKSVNSNMNWKVVEFGELFFAYNQNEVKERKITSEILANFEKEFNKFKKHIEDGKETKSN